MFYLSVCPNFVNNQTSFHKCQLNFSTFHERFEPCRIYRSDDVAVGEKINVHSDWLLLARENSSNNQSQRASSLEQRKKINALEGVFLQFSSLCFLRCHRTNLEQLRQHSSRWFRAVPGSLWFHRGTSTFLAKRVFVFSELDRKRRAP